MRFARNSNMTHRFGRAKAVFYMPYAVVFILVGVVGWQLLGTSSAATNGAADVTLELSKSSYSVGDVVRFTIRNSSAAEVSVANNCPDVPLEVYLWQTGEWVRQHDSADDSKCLNAPRSYAIAPQGFASASYIYWPKIFAQPGHYRIVAPIEQQTAKPSVEFNVVAR